MNFSIHQASYIGNRKFNQDRVAYVYSQDALLLVLADGMGGHQHGELAAALAMRTFVEAFARQDQQPVADLQAFLAETMLLAHQTILKLPHDEGDRGYPGTTCVAALLHGGRLYAAYAGDSRLYVLRDGRVITRTSDHSVVQQWLELGIISAEEARTHPQRNLITNSLGGAQDMFYAEPVAQLELRSGDVVLLASDGLWGPFTDSEIATGFAKGLVVSSLPQVLEELLKIAYEREIGHSDNLTGIAVRWGNGEAAHDTDKPVSHILEII